MLITLRCWEKSDASRLLEIRQDPELEHQLPPLASLTEAEKLIESLVADESRMVWCLEADGVASGLVGISYSGDGAHGGFDRGWVYYWAAENLRGRRVMKQAVRAVCDFAQGIKLEETILELPQGTLDCSVFSTISSPQLRRLELGYRTNNPASRAVALGIGFVEEGIERQKFCYDGILYDAVIAGRLQSDIGSSCLPLKPAFHHVELWTQDFQRAYPQWDWLLTALGFALGDHWRLGTSWSARDGSYLVLEQSVDVSGEHERTRAGLNHLAFSTEKETIISIRKKASDRGWTELYPESFPFAGGEQHYALYLENSQGFEVELVATF